MDGNVVSKVDFLLINDFLQTLFHFMFENITCNVFNRILPFAGRGREVVTV